MRKIAAIITVLLICVFLSVGTSECGAKKKVIAGSSYQPNIIFTPYNLVATIISSDQIDLSWIDNSDNEDGFKIERKIINSNGGYFPPPRRDGNGVPVQRPPIIEDDEDYTEIATVGRDVTTYSDSTPITDFKVYYYRIKAINTICESSYSNEAYIETSYISSPWGLSARTVSFYQTELSWNCYITTADGFKIERKIDSTGDWVQIAAVATDANNMYGPYYYSDQTALPWSTHYYRIRAYDGFRDSDYSNEATPNMSELFILTFNPISTSQIDLSWADNFTDEISFGIERKIGRSGTWMEIAQMDANIIYYSDITSTGFDQSTNYYYRVKASKNESQNVYSNEVGWVFSGNWSKVEAGAIHSIGLKKDGTLWSWGSNWYGELGLGDSGWNTWRNTPTQVGIDSDWSLLAAGDYHNLATKSNGTLWSWGFNDYGVLGLGDSGWGNERNTPAQVGIDSDWSLLAAGSYHNLATKSNGTLWAWGTNWSGELGLGDSGNERNTPAQVGIDSDWSLIAAGSYHNLATKSNGTVWAWGSNWYGELGLGDVINRNTPTIISSDFDWQPFNSIDMLATGYSYSIVRKTNGTLWSWGYNYYGQLGLGDNLDTYAPLAVNASDWSSITAGNNHTIALKTNGTLWSWGDNWNGQLGLGNNLSTYVPLAVNASDWSSITAGGFHSLALKTNGTLWVWGNNEYGQLGLGDSGWDNGRNVPTLVGE